MLELVISMYSGSGLCLYPYKKGGFVGGHVHFEGFLWPVMSIKRVLCGLSCPCRED